MAAAKKTSEKKLNEGKEDGNIQESNPDTTQAVEERATEEEVKATKAKPLAKSGKRSAKAVAETEEKIAKEERKAKQADAEAEPVKPKAPVVLARSRLERAGKKLREASKLVNKDEEYSLKNALELAVKTSTTSFDATAELHINLNVDPRQADQNLRDTIVLPAGTGKTVRIAVFAEGDDADDAKKAGADIAGGDEFLQQLDKSTVDFDVLIATPAGMPKLGKYAKLLGPKGLMPNPKSGTVTTNVKKAIDEAKAGRVEYRVDSTGIVHVGIGKVSFGADKLVENAQAVLSSIKANKPASIKGTFVKSIFVSTSMGPSVKVAISEM